MNMSKSPANSSVCDLRTSLEIYDIQKQMRAKEADLTKQIALLKQEIDILKIQLKESYERENQQKCMYDRMFQALDSQEQVSTDFKVECDDSEIEAIRNKARQDQQSKITCLEVQLEQKELVIEKQVKEIQELTKKNEEQIGSIEKLQQELVCKSDEIKRLTSQTEFMKADYDRQRMSIETEFSQKYQVQQEEFDEIKLQFQGQLKDLKIAINEQANDQVIEQLREEITRLAQDKVSYEDAMSKLEAHNNKLTKRVTDLKQIQLDLEVKEKTLESQIDDQEREHEKDKQVLKSRIYTAEGKLARKKEKLREVKQEYKQSNDQISKMKRDLDKIKDRNKELQSNVDEKIMHHKLFNRAARKSIGDFESCMEEESVPVNKLVSPRHEAYRTPTKSEIPNNADKFRKMMEFCSRLECYSCHKLMQCAYFYDHVVKGNCIPSIKNSSFHTHSDFQVDESDLYGRGFQSFYQDRVGTQLRGGNDDMHTERSTTQTVSILEQKLRRADELLRESAFEIKNLRNQKAQLENDLHRSASALEQAMTHLAISEEKKTESELEMKKEIKYLLEQWLKTNPQNEEGISSEGDEQIQVQYTGKNNASVLTNFNPLIHLDTFENQGVEPASLVQQYLNYPGTTQNAQRDKVEFSHRQQRQLKNHQYQPSVTNYSSASSGSFDESIPFTKKSFNTKVSESRQSLKLNQVSSHKTSGQKRAVTSKSFIGNSSRYA